MMHNLSCCKQSLPETYPVSGPSLTWSAYIQDESDEHDAGLGIIALLLPCSNSLSHSAGFPQDQDLIVGGGEYLDGASLIKINAPRIHRRTESGCKKSRIEIL